MRPTLLLFLFCFSSIIYAQQIKFDLANQKLERGYYKEAIADFTDLLDEENKDFNHLFYYGRAYSYYNKGNNKLAVKDLKKVYQAKDSLNGSNITKGNSYWLEALIVANGTPSKKSVKLLKKASNYIQSSLLYSTIGYDQVFIKKTDEAIVSLNKAIELDSKNAWAYSNMALAYLRKKELTKARTYIMQSISIDNKNPFVYKHSGMILIEIGDISAACEELQKAKNLELENRMNKTGLSEIDRLIEKHCGNN